tara:strand:+ start:194 stop:565 length:372 start_codon:yes stop_codon:yes gene_type:complete
MTIQTRPVNSFPRDLVDKIYETQGYRAPTQPSHRDSFIEDMPVKIMSAGHIQFEDLIIVPGHNWDLREANIELLASDNLQQVGHTHLRNAATATIYRKIDPSAPAYIIFSWAPNDEEYFIYEF